jgi:hypothetical protein
VLFYGEQKKFPQIDANPLFMRLAIPFTGTSIQRPDLLRSFYFWAINGSPAPLFETVDDRLSFVIRLPRHPLALGMSGADVVARSGVNRNAIYQAERFLMTDSFERFINGLLVMSGHGCWRRTNQSFTPN